MADVTLNIRHNADQATSSVNSLSNAMGRMASQSKSAATAGTAAANGFNKIGHACLNVGKSASRGASGISKFVSSLGRIAFYRAIRTAIKYVGQAFNEGLKAAYAFSKASQPADYAKLAGAMDALKASAKTMSLQLGAAFGGLITAIAPVLIQIINLVTQAAEAITRFFAVLNGTGYYKKAASGFEEVGNSAGGAGKKIKGLLASWDELNVIGKESGGGGGGSSATDYSGAYIWQPAESEFTTALLEGNLSRVGEIIGEQLREWGEKIDEWFGKYFGNDYEYWSDGLQGLVDLVAGVLRGMGFETAAYNVELFAEKIKAALGLVSEYYNGFVEALESSRLYAIILGWERGITEFDKEFKQWGLSIAQTIQNSWALRKLFGDQSESILNFSIGIEADNEKLNELAEKIEELVETGEKGINIDAHVDHEKVDQYKETLKTPFKTKVNAVPGTQLDGTELFTSGTAYRPSGSTAGKKVGVGVAVVPSVGTSEKLEPKNLFTPNSGVTSPSGNTLALGITPKITPVEKVEIPATANYTDWEVHGSKSDAAVRTFTTWNSRANYTDWSVKGSKTGANVSNFTTWDSTANWKVQKTDPKWAGTTWNSTANWKDQKTDPKWAGTIWNSTANFTKRTVASTFDTTFNATAKVTATLNKDDLRKQFKDSLNGVKININSTVDGVRKNVGKINTVAEYAEGGWPTIGDLFIANEAGPEYVASIGSRTAVANNDDIVQGIQGGVERANAEQNELIRQQNSILAKLLNKELTINPSVALGQVVARSTAMYGRA